MRTLEQLIDISEPGWPLVAEWLSRARASVEVLPANSPQADQGLLAMQVTTRSPMGAIVHATGGLLFDNGWLRVLGSGHERLPRSLGEWNCVSLAVEYQRLPGACLFADDVIGGFFALNGGAFDAELGHVQYFAPDTLGWEDMKMTYSNFLMWACSDRLALFYEGFRWHNWQEQVQTVGGENGLSVYPFLWAEGPALAERSKKVVPMKELYGLEMDIRNQMMKAIV